MQHFGSAQQSLWKTERAKCILKWRHTYREPPGGSLKVFFFLKIQIKQRGQSIGISEHTEVLNTVARKKVFHFDLKFEWLWSLWHVHIKCSAFPIFLSLRSTANSVVSRGMTKCVNVAVLVLFHDGASELPESTRGAAATLSWSCCHLHTLMHSRHIHTLLHTFRHTHNSSDRPNSEWIILHQTNSPCPLKERSVWYTNSQKG